MLLTFDIIIAGLLSAILWSLLASYTKWLKIAVLEHTSLYSFLLSIDLVLLYKHPNFTFAFLSQPVTDITSFKLCAIVTIVTVSCAVLGLFLDARAEQHLQQVIDSVAHAEARALEELPAGRLARLGQRIRNVWERIASLFQLRSWYAWRNLHSGILLLLTSAHVYGLVAIKMS